MTRLIGIALALLVAGCQLPPNAGPYFYSQTPGQTPGEGKSYPFYHPETNHCWPPKFTQGTNCPSDPLPGTNQGPDMSAQREQAEHNWICAMAGGCP